jgi:hypothetical protein
MNADFWDDPHEKLAPVQRVEVQDYYLMSDTKKRDFRDSKKPERRHPSKYLPPQKQLSWPRPWPVHGVDHPALRNPFPESYKAKNPGGRGIGNQNARRKDKA